MDFEHGHFLLSHDNFSQIGGVQYLYDEWNGSVIYKDNVTEVIKKKQVELFGSMRQLPPIHSELLLWHQ